MSNNLLTLQNIKIMKLIKTKVLLLIIFLAFNKRINAQTAGSYITNTTMGAFHGTWQWVNGSDTVKIYLETKKVYCDVNGGFYWDELVGWHLYKKGSSIIQNTIPYINNVSQAAFFAGNEGRPYGVAWGTLKDITKNKSGEVILTLNAAQNQLTWKLDISPGIKVFVPGVSPTPQRGFTLPENMLLIKL